MSCRPGVFAFPRHYVNETVDWIRAYRPSVVKAFASVTSPDWWQAVAAASPESVRVLVHGEISDNPDLSSPEADAEATARLLDSDRRYPRLVISKNEVLHSTHPTDYWQRWADYMCRWVTRAHAVGFDCVVGELNTGHPAVYAIDGVDQWTRLASVDAAMGERDYWGLHEYWGTAGPEAWWPWTCGRHLTCPTRHSILIDEVGFDRYVEAPEPDFQRRGWRAHMTAEQYVGQIVAYHQALTDPRVKGTALFLLDYDNNEWAAFDLWEARDLLLSRRDECDAVASWARMPDRLGLPLDHYVRITQTFAQHPGISKGLDFSAYTGTSVLAAADGTVDKVIDLGSASYGRYITVNHGWGMTLYAHLSEMLVGKGQRVRRGERIGLSGSTGYSTGPHLHFEVRPLTANRSPYRVDPAPLLGLGGGVVPPEEDDMDEATKTEIRNTVWNQMGIAYNPDAALAKFAKAKGLGAPKDGEQRLVVNGKAYIIQPFDGAIAAVPEGEWDAVESIPWN